MSQSNYEVLRHALDSKMIQSSTLTTEPERIGFVNRTFSEIHKMYKEKRVDHVVYIRLVNRLSAYHEGAYNDYIDVLAGAAQMGMLEVVMQSGIPIFSPERERRESVNNITNTEPIQPEEGL